MRGLGIGILLATLILSIVGNKEKLSEKEIIKRAEALGMVMADEQKDQLDKMLEGMDITPTVAPSPEVTIEPTVIPTEAPEASSETQADSMEAPEASTEAPTDSTEASADSTEVPAQPTEALKEPTGAPKDPTEAPVQPTKTPASSNKSITITIKKGQTSDDVAELLYEKGIVKSAKSFNSFIVKEGRARIIRTGDFKIPKDASYQEIMDIITKD